MSSNQRRCGVALTTAATWIVCAAFSARAGDIQSGLVTYFDLNEGQGNLFQESLPYGSTVDRGAVSQFPGTQGTHWQWVDGKFGKAIYFDPDFGDTADYTDNQFSYAAVDDTSADVNSLIGAGKSFSIALWVKLGANGDTNACGKILWRSWNDLGYNYDNYRYQLWQRFDDQGTVAAMALDTSGNSTDVWQHVAYVIDDSARKVLLYVNGALVVQGDFAAGDPYDETGPWYFGAIPNPANGLPCHMTIDELRFYDRALTAGDIAMFPTYVPFPTASVAVTADASEPGQAGSFTFSVTQSSTADLTLAYTVSGTASADVDYEALTLQAVIPAGAHSVDVPVTVNDDVEAEGAETIVVTLASGSGYTLGEPLSAELTLNDNDSLPLDFALLLPTDGTEVNPEAANELSWEQSAGATTYTVTVATDASLVDVVRSDVVAGGQTTSLSLPALSMPYNATLYWSVTAVNISGETLSTPASLSFRTDADTTPPSVASTVPSAGEDEADISEDVRVVFSEALDPASIEGAVTMTGPYGPVSGSVWLSGDRTIVFTPAEELEYDSDYSLSVDPTVTDLVGNELGGGGYSFSFKTDEELLGVGAGEGCAAGTGSARTGLLMVALAATLGGLARRRHREFRPEGRTMELGTLLAAAMLIGACTADQTHLEVARPLFAALDSPPNPTPSFSRALDGGSVEVNWAPRGGVVVFMGGDKDIPARPTLGTFARLLEDDDKRIEVSLELTPDVAGSDETNMYVLVVGDYVGFIGAGGFFWKAGAGGALEVRGDDRWLTPIAEAGVGLWVPVRRDSALVVNATLQLPLSEASTASMMALNVGYEF